MPNFINALGNNLSGATGTGSFVGSNSPTLVTPNLGTPSTLILDNATGLPSSALPASTFYCRDNTNLPIGGIDLSAVDAELAIGTTISDPDTFGAILMGKKSGSSSNFDYITMQVDNSASNQPSHMYFTNYCGTTTGNNDIIFFGAKGSYASPVALQDGHNIWGTYFAGYNGTAFADQGRILCRADGNLTGSNNGTKFEFWNGAPTSGSAILSLTIDKNQLATFTGNIVAPQITSTLIGNASTATSATTATTATNATNITGGVAGSVLYQSGAGVTDKLTATVAGALVSDGAGILSYKAISSDGTTDTLVQYGSGGDFSAGTITASSFSGPLAGNASTATSATNIQGGTANQIAFQTGSGVTTFMTAGANKVLVTDGSNVPSLASTIAASNLPSYQNQTSWTPSDNSGASLVFTSVVAVYDQIANGIFPSMQLTYPTTVDGSNVAIDGLPFSATVDYIFTATADMAVITAKISGGQRNITLFNATTGAQFTNALLSGKQITLSGYYSK